MSAMILSSFSSVCLVFIIVFCFIPPSFAAEASVYALADVSIKDTSEPLPTIVKKAASLIRHEPGHRSTTGGSVSPESTPPILIGADERHDDTSEPLPTIVKKAASLIRHEPGHRSTIGGSFSPESPPILIGADETTDANVGEQRLTTNALNGIMDALAEVILCVVGFAIAITLQKMLRRSGRHPRLHNRRVISGLVSDQSVGKAPPTKKGVVLTTTATQQVPASRRRTDAPLPMPRDNGDANTNHGGGRSADDMNAPSLQSEIKSLVTAINRGRAEKLPQLLDVALSRLERYGGADRDACGRHAEELLINVLRACAAYGAFWEAIAAYDCVSKRIGHGDRSLWSLLLYVATEAADFSRGLHFYSKLQSIAMPSGNDLVNIVRCLAHEGDLKNLEQVLADLKLGANSSGNKGFDNVIRNRALSACSKQGVLEFAVAVARSDIFIGHLDAVAYNTLMTCYAREGQFAQVFSLYEEMKAANIKRTPVTFGVLIDACVSADDFDRAKAVSRELSACGLSVNAVHCTTLIKGLIGAGRIPEAEQLFSEMLVSKNAKPDIITYSTLVKAYAEQGNVKAALRIFSGMQDQGISPDEIICNAIFSACAVRPLSGSEIQIVVDKVTTTCDLKPSTITLSIVLKAFAKARAWQHALTFLRNAPDCLSVKPEIRLYLQLAQDCVKADDNAKLLDIHDAMVQQLRRYGEEVDENVSKRLLRQCNGRADGPARWR